MNSSSKTFAPSGRGAVCTIASIAIPIAAILFGPAKAAEANLPEPVIPTANLTASSNPPTEAERKDGIVCAFFYGGYRNPSVSGRWRDWNLSGTQPPETWASHYIPNYPDSTWNPSVQLYDSLDTKVLEWQGEAMKRAGVKIAVLSWYSQGGYEDDVLAKASRICNDVQWCIVYEPEGNYDPSPQEIYDDIKWVLGRNKDSNNYAKIDGKWLVFVNLFSQRYSSANAQDAANRWSEAKKMLAADGYELYLNADLKDEYLLPEHPWDAVHRFILYNPTDYQHFSDTDIDDSACVFPGYWSLSKDEPYLERSLDKFKLALEQIVADSENYRFILTTWNNWARGTQIESGQDYASGDNYGSGFIDALASIANILPVHLGAEEMIPYEDTRIGASILSPYQSNMTFTVRAKSMLEKDGNPNMTLYLDDVVAAQWEVEASAYGRYSAVVPLQKGIYKVEIGGGNLAVDYLRICKPIPGDLNGDCYVDMYDLAILASVWESKPGDVRWNPDYDLTDDDVVYMGDLYALSEKWLADISSMSAASAARKKYEGFETGDFSEFPWMYSGDSDWTITSSEKLSETYSAQTGMIGDDESSALELTLNCTSGDITFSRKVSSESGYDYLKFYIDGIEQDNWSGEQDWEEVSFPVAPGQRTFKWIYSKDYSVSEGDDTAWIDDITFPIDD